jgi:multidrug efflux pump subunit AcrB
MRSLIRFFVHNSLFGDLLTLVVIVAGVYALFNIRREVFPNVSFDVINVRTIYPGASAEEVEKYVTNKIEQELTEVDGVKKITSVSVENLSEIFVFLDIDQTTAKKGKTDVETIVDRLQDLPKDIDDPLVSDLESKNQPIIEVAVASDLPAIEVRDIAKKLETEFESIDGVARVAPKGLRKKEVRVEVSSAKLIRYKLSLEDIVNALRSQNISIPGGTIEPPVGQLLAEKEKLVRVNGEFKSIEDIKNTVIRANDYGQAIKVGDVAKVYLDLEKATVKYRTNGVPSLSLTILKKERADAIGVVDRVMEKVEDLKKIYGEKISFSYINDFSEYIRRRLGILTGNLMIGLTLVLLLLPLMIPFRFSLIIAMGEPFAFLGAILVLYLMGSSINLVSMIGLIIVSGILVDDSIVVTENAVRLIEEEGMDPKEAAVEGTMQIMGPVSASVATTALAFVPMLFMSGIFGKIAKEIPTAVLACLAVSLFETYFILPGHIAHWISKKSNRQTSIPRNPISRLLESSRNFWDSAVQPMYIRYLKVALNGRYIVLAGVGVLFAATLALALTRMKVVLFPPEGVEIFFIRVESPHGTGVDTTAELMKPIEEVVKQYPKSEVKDFTATIGIVQQDPNDPNTKRGGEYGQVAVFLTPENLRERKATEIIDEMRNKIGLPIGLAKISFERVNPGPPAGKPVSIGVRGPSFEAINKGVAAVEEFLAKVPGVSDIRNSYATGKEEILIKVDPIEATAANLTVAEIGNSVRASFEGIVATKMNELHDEIDVRVSFPKEERSQSTSLDNVLIANRLGSLVPLPNIAKFEKGQGIAAFEHEENSRQVKVTAEINTDVNSSIAVNAEVQKMVDSYQKQNPELNFAFGGEDEDTRESFQSLGRAFIGAVAGIFLILVLTFRGILQPLLVVLTIPLGFMAVIWAFFLHNIPITFMGCLGIVALAGTIVNNAIVYIDFVNQALKTGQSFRDAVEGAARLRLRPIFLTTITTVIGVLPTAYGIGGLDKFVVPIALALGWGIFFGSILTAFVFPSALLVLNDVQSLMRRYVPKLAGWYD